ncbi:hypothetical protein CSAL01_08123 [Colletotrichum salicis]|uniref:Uncharacterized protein n=1 Tax=Colletotrichum salicis TaxID=1209931 RepID=A0A135UXL4_9PEZI|nr:hypothetical protein CSAL01_08123 [Colletotrichum salicis]
METGPAETEKHAGDVARQNGPILYPIWAMISLTIGKPWGFWDRLVSRRAAGYPSESTDYRASWAGAHAAGARRGVGEERGGMPSRDDGGVLSPCDYAGAGVFDEQ